MTPARFAALADAYGGTIDLWPAAERDAAHTYLAAHPDAATLLQQQAALDSLLAAWAVPGPGAALAGHIAISAGRRHAWTRRVRLWASGLGAAAALASGVAVGVSLVAMLQPPPGASGWRLYQLTVLGAPLDIDADGGS